MPKEIQNPFASYSLVDALGLKGRFPLQVDEVTVPFLSLLDVERSPYNRACTPCGGAATCAAAPAVFSAVAVQAAPGIILEVLSFCVAGTANQNYSAFWMDGTEIQLWSGVASTNLINLSVQDPQVTLVSPYRPRVQSVIRTLTRNLAGTNELVILRIPSTNSEHYTFPQKVFLDGDASLGPSALLVHCGLVNVSTVVSFNCREWKPRG